MDSLSVLLLSVDEVMETPERMNLCQHYQNRNLCTFSKIKIIDYKTRTQNCESSESVSLRDDGRNFF